MNGDKPETVGEQIKANIADSPGFSIGGLVVIALSILCAMGIISTYLGADAAHALCAAAGTAGGTMGIVGRSPWSPVRR